MLKNMASALPQDSGEKQSAEELENIDRIAIGKCIKWERQNLIMYEKRGITTSNSIGQRYIFVLT